MEGRRAEHVHLIDDIYIAFPWLRGESHLLYQGPDIVNRVIAGGVQFVDVEGGAVVEGYAGRTGVTGLAFRADVLAIDGLGQDTGTGGLANATRTAKQESMC